MSYTHLSIIERSKLEILHHLGKSARSIARELGRYHATICRELRRNETQDPYRAERSQESYVQRRKSSIPAGKWTPQQSVLIEEKLHATWSPEQIVEGHPVVCFKTIYRWLYTGRLVKGGLVSYVTKVNGRSLQRHAASSLWVRPSLSVRKRFVPGKPSVIGNSIRSSQVVGKVRAA